MAGKLTMKENAGGFGFNLRISAGQFGLKQSLFVETEFDDFFVKRATPDP